MFSDQLSGYSGIVVTCTSELALQLHINFIFTGIYHQITVWGPFKGDKQ